MEAEEGPDPPSVDQNTIVRATSGPESITTLADALGMPTGARGHGHLGGLLSGRLGDNRYEVRMCPRAARSGAPLRMILEYLPLLQLGLCPRLAMPRTLAASAMTPNAKPSSKEAPCASANAPLRSVAILSG